MKKNLPVLTALLLFFSLPAFAQLKVLQSPGKAALKWPFTVKTIEPVSKKIKLPAITIRKPLVVSISPENISRYTMVQCPLSYHSNPYMLLQAERSTPQMVDLKWETKYLVDNSGFNIEQSFNDTFHFKRVDFVSAHLKSSIKEEYTLKNFNEYMNRTYYRLKQFNMNNSYVYSNIVSVDGVRPFKLFPNPVGNQVNIQIATKQTGSATIIVYDALGRALHSKTAIMIKDVLNNQSIEVANLKAGIYFTKVFMADKSVRSGIFIKK